jgi:hypothetical protein
LNLFIPFVVYSLNLQFNDGSQRHIKTSKPAQWLCWHGFVVPKRTVNPWLYTVHDTPLLFPGTCRTGGHWNVHLSLQCKATNGQFFRIKILYFRESLL